MNDRIVPASRKKNIQNIIYKPLRPRSRKQKSSEKSYKTNISWSHIGIKHSNITPLFTQKFRILFAWTRLIITSKKLLHGSIFNDWSEMYASRESFLHIGKRIYLYSNIIIIQIFIINLVITVQQKPPSYAENYRQITILDNLPQQATSVLFHLCIYCSIRLCRLPHLYSE